MMIEGFFRVASAVPTVKLADCTANAKVIIAMSEKIAAEGARLIVFPEMAVTGYTCGDLFHNATLYSGAQDALAEIAEASKAIGALLMVGAPVKDGNQMYNCAVAIAGGEILAAIPKTAIPNYNEFQEKRWWHSGATVDSFATVGHQEGVFLNRNFVIDVDGVKVGAEICEDLWSPNPPSTAAALAGAQVIVNLSASNETLGKYSYLTKLIESQSARTLSAYVYAGAGAGESSTDLVFDGKAIIAENGKIIARNERWTPSEQYVIADVDIEAINRDRMVIGAFADQVPDAAHSFDRLSANLPNVVKANNLLRRIDPSPFVPSNDTDRDELCNEVINIQVFGLAQRLRATGCEKLVVGISGGLDSTLALLVAVETFDRLGLDRKGVIGITMPGFGTTGRTYYNALTLMETLGVTSREIPIRKAVEQHFDDIGHDVNSHDVTYENSQARERTQILMDVANQVGGMVLGTGDLSELALGWATYNGDHMSMYGVNAGVPKTLISHLVRWFAVRNTNHALCQSLLDIVDTPISPELIPADDKDNITQKTEDLVGPYELHDFFLYYTLRYGYSPKRIFALAQVAFEGLWNSELIKHWLKVFFRRFFNQQFKRSCMPDGPKVGSVSLSPRGDWRMPSDASSALWLSEIDQL